MKGGTSNPTDMLAACCGGKSQPRQSDAAQGNVKQDAPALPVLCGDLSMRIAHDGTWYYQGSPIGRLPLVKLFASVLRREADGDYWLITPAERGRIIVDDAPFVAVEVSAEGRGREQRLTFRTNLDEEVVAGNEHPIRAAADSASQAPIPYILVRSGLEARILRPVFYHLVEFGEQQGDQFGVWSSGRFFPLGWLDPAL